MVQDSEQVDGLDLPLAEAVKAELLLSLAWLCIYPHHIATVAILQVFFSYNVPAYASHLRYTL